MPLPSGVRRAFRLLVPSSLRDELREELEFHLDERIRDLAARGMSPREARLEAAKRFGDPEEIRAQCLVLAATSERRARWRRPLEEALRDLAVAVRSLRRRPGFALAAIATLALGLGTNAAVYRAVESVALRPLPFPDAGRLVAVSGTFEAGEVELRAASYPEIRDWREGVASFAHLAAVSAGPVGLTGRGSAEPAERIDAVFVDPAYFDVLAVEPALGRALEAADNLPPRGLAHAVLGAGLWQRRFAGDRDVVGRMIEVDGTRFEVVGVMPAGFAGTSGEQELWLPIRAGVGVVPGWGDEGVFEERESRGLGVVGRLVPDASLAEAQAEIDVVSRRLELAHPEAHADRGAQVRPLRELLFGDARESSWLLLAAAALVWLVACVNVTNLLLARLTDRRRELAIRAALGATRGRLGFQVLAESLVLAVAGGMVGFLVAGWSAEILSAWRPADLPAYAARAGESPAVGFLVVLTGATAVLLALAPMWGVVRRSPGRWLGQGRMASGDVRPSAFRWRPLHLSGRRLLVAGEVAVALVVLLGAALLVQSFRAQARLDPGFDATDVMAARVQLPDERYDLAATRRFAADLEERLQSLPGARSVALGSDIPLVSGYRATYTQAADRLAEDPEHRIRIYFHRVTPGFFATAGIRLVAGRTFGPVSPDADLAATGEEVVVSQKLADVAWPGESPLGKHLLFGDRPPSVVVGVAAAVRYRSLTPDPASPEDPDLYLPLAGRPPRQIALFVRHAPGIEIPPAALQEVVAELDPELPLFEAGPLAEALRQQTAVARFSSRLFVLFGALALVLALVGVYGTMAYDVARRRHEIGVRMALGAARLRILGQVLGEGAAVAATGVVLGLAGAWAASRLIAANLYATDAGDPVTYAASAFVLAATVLAASWIPARKAASIPPVRALEME